jgi:hypothetical protein
MMMIRHQRRQKCETRDGKVGTLPQKLDTVLEPPERDVKARIDYDDIGHGTVPCYTVKLNNTAASTSR